MAQSKKDWNTILAEANDIYSTKVTTSGTVSYIGIATPGTSQTDARWQVTKIDYTNPNDIIILFAGKGQFNQIATDLTTLTYE